jgi:C4-dicarboxylate transporter, DctM subunit
MEPVLIVTALIALLILRTPVAFALGGLGVILLAVEGLPLVAIPQRLYGTMDSFELLAVPMFLLMANILLKGGIGRDLFAAVQSWVGHWPGGLGVATILSCTLFSAISGSSVATAATIGTVAIPEMAARGYNRSFTLGLLAAGGTLGILIPPSIPLIVYGIITEESIPTLFKAGIGPGLFLAGIFVLYSIAYAKLGGKCSPVEKAAWRERGLRTLLALPTLLLAVVVIGSIYTGIATPSESAGIGFVLALVITFGMGRMTWEKVKAATYASMSTTVMIFLIIAGAKVFSYAITLYLIPQTISQVLAANLTDAGLFILAVGAVLLIIGFFLEALSMLLIMVPVLLPSLETMGINPIWFGIFFVILIETALITPPVGLNLFVIQAVGRASLREVVQGAWPFAVMMLATTILLWFLPDLALYIAYKL